MPHLIAEQVCGRVLLCHERSECVTQVVVFELNPQLAFDFPCRVFEGVDRLDGAVWQTVHKLRGGNFFAAEIVNKSLLLLPDSSKLFFIL